MYYKNYWIKDWQLQWREREEWEKLWRCYDTIEKRVNDVDSRLLQWWSLIHPVYKANLIKYKEKVLSYNV